MIEKNLRWNRTLVDEPLLHIGVVLVVHTDCAPSEFGLDCNGERGEEIPSTSSTTSPGAIVDE
jgi:hypothetical protein